MSGWNNYIAGISGWNDYIAEGKYEGNHYIAMALVYWGWNKYSLSLLLSRKLIKIQATV